MLLTLALAALCAPQLDDEKRRTPLIPPPAGEAAGDTAESPSGRDAQPGAGGAQRAPAEGPEAGASTAGPRALGEQPPPFETPRALLRVDGVAVTSSELNALVRYYRSFRPGSDDLLLRDAFAALLPAKAVQARYGEELEEMRARMDAAVTSLEEGTDFAQVVAAFSDDDEAPTDDGSYVFGREVAVQPFDRLAHTPPMDTRKGPFLTKYGVHVLEVTGYARDPRDPAEDETTVRHVLVMYPSLRAVAEAGGDVRAHIDAIVDEARIEVLEPGLEAMVPPERRDQLTSVAPLPPAPEEGGADGTDADGGG